MCRLADSVHLRHCLHIDRLQGIEGALPEISAPKTAYPPGRVKRLGLLTVLMQNWVVAEFKFEVRGMVIVPAVLLRPVTAGLSRAMAAYVGGRHAQADCQEGVDPRDRGSYGARKTHRPLLKRR